MSAVNKASLLTDKDVVVGVLFTTYADLGYIMLAIGRAHRNAIASLNPRLIMYKDFIICTTHL